MTKYPDTDGAEISFPTAQERERYRQIASECSSPVDLIIEMRRIRLTVNRFQHQLEEKIIDGMLMRLTDITLRVAVHGVPDEDALLAKLEAFKVPMRYDSPYHNLVPMLQAAIDSDANRVAPHLAAGTWH